MIRGDHDVQHALAHLEIGAPAIDATITQRRFRASALSYFFAALRNGHHDALASHDRGLEAIVGQQEVHDLDEYGVFGRFAGRMAISENGLAVVESTLHHDPSEQLKNALQASLTNAVGILRSS